LFTIDAQYSKNLQLMASTTATSKWFTLNLTTVTQFQAPQVLNFLQQIITTIIHYLYSILVLGYRGDGGFSWDCLKSVLRHRLKVCTVWQDIISESSTFQMCGMGLTMPAEQVQFEFSEQTAVGRQMTAEAEPGQLLG